MNDNAARLGPCDQQIVELLLQGCENSEIAKQLRMSQRTVKARFNRLFVQFGITCGIKRVKLATLLYRRRLSLRPGASDRPIRGQPNHKIIGLVAQGLKNRDIADLIGTTEDAIKNQLRVVYDSLGMWNRVELALWYEARISNPKWSGKTPSELSAS